TIPFLSLPFSTKNPLAPPYRTPTASPVTYRNPIRPLMRFHPHPPPLPIRTTTRTLMNPAKVRRPASNVLHTIASARMTPSPAAPSPLLILRRISRVTTRNT
ncbi:hypothetical protein PENTCL1PPCAC_26232, partial [Pristionchus entomophagus]